MDVQDPRPDKTQNHINPPNNRERLLITRIVNENFKSYAGVQTLGPFHQSFNAIVGPNGSGKSNVIDAMLFVFGYRSTKIRSKKLSLLIHKSDQFPNLESCTVAVHFQKIIDTSESSYDVVPDSEFVVMRTAREDGSSDYYLDGKRVTYKEVTTLLKKSGIDLDHNRFLILQGEVEQISLMKPKAPSEHEDGMLEYLEDIIGTCTYKEPILALSAEIEALNEQRGEKLNRVKAVAKEKDELKEPNNTAVTFLQTENTVASLKNQLFQKLVLQCQQEVDSSSVRRGELSNQIQTIDKQIQTCMEEKTKQTKDMETLQANYEDSSKEVEHIKKQLAAMEKQLITQTQGLDHSKQSMAKNMKAMQKEKEKLEDLLAVPARRQSELGLLHEKLKNLEIKRKDEEEMLLSIMEAIKTDTLDLQKEKEAKEKELVMFKMEENKIKSKLEIAQSELDMYTTSYTQLKTQLQAVQSKLEHAEKTKMDKQKEAKAVVERLPSAQAQLAKFQATLSKASSEEEKLNAELYSGRTRLEEGKSALHASKSRSTMLQAFLKEKESGRMCGLLGRLGDLGAIDDKYDVAISTACGALDNIVVDTIDTAEAGVEFLRRTNAGRATFICLDKMEVWKSRSETKIKTPENVPRLFDLVKVKDQKVRPAFYFALRDTLVADDLDQATRIAYQNSQRWRVVTIQGQLIDTSGTMSGGGTQVQKGRMSSKLPLDTDPRELDLLEKKVNDQLTQLETVKRSRVDAQNSINSISREIPQLEMDKQKVDVELESISHQIIDLTLQLEQLEKQLKEAVPNASRLTDLENSVRALEKEYKCALQNTLPTEMTVRSLQEKLVVMTTGKIKSQQTVVDTLINEIDLTNEDITKATVAIKTAARNQAKAHEKISELEEDIRVNQKEVESLEIGIEKSSQSMEDRKLELNTAVEHQVELGKRLHAATSVSSQANNVENSLRSQMVDLRHEMEQVESGVADVTNQIKHWRTERANLVIQTLTGLGPSSDILPTLTQTELDDINCDQIKAKIRSMEDGLKSIKPNLAVIQEYRRKEEQYLARAAELDQVTELRDVKRTEFEALKKRRLDEFMTGFSIITMKLKEMYRMITLGGDAELELVDSLDPFAEGIVFSVRPPNKSWKNISNLSGGEKTLSSLALVFALHHYKPTPLYVMDEIDAALDFKNVSIVANYIKERTKNAQFIIISLRNNMFELCDRLVGIYKTSNCTKTICINPAAVESAASAPVVEN